ncbi:helix-turn-helix domain-containing protein [Streptomyces sp. NPDC093111]|uniref:TetR/AcrR family transcriptional regulator n=1 Tax=Streptomyces sp. NPDC093111 TaxID=3154978 RepID=UPI00343D2623
MPTARETLLDTALAALGARPWSAVRMVDVAARARVSRQTLYNEFGSKEGLARALVRREADRYLRGVEAVLAEAVPAGALPAEPGPYARGLLAVAEWTVAAAAARPVLRALLTGAWDERLPAPRPVRVGSRLAPVPEQRRADAGVPTPGELLAQARDRAASLIARGPDGGDGEGAGHAEAAGDAEAARAATDTDDTAAVLRSCELALRLALSFVVASTGREAEGERVCLVRDALFPQRVSGRTPTAGGR